MGIWRLCRLKFVDQAFHGIGAKLYGGRWNEPGLPVVYTASSLSLAMVETFVHLDDDLIPDDYVAIAADVPSEMALTRLNVADLPPDWRNYPPPDTLKQIGSEWLRSKTSAVLAVPSVVIPQEENYLLNPEHISFSRVIIHPAVPFQFDPRMWK